MRTNLVDINFKRRNYRRPPIKQTITRQTKPFIQEMKLRYGSDRVDKKSMHGSSYSHI